ncbi:hypothetical protein [Pseudonocardia sp. H11422]|nr:hypothetical protein [Pseudonocardia sp. H11422]
MLALTVLLAASLLMPAPWWIALVLLTALVIVLWLLPVWSTCASPSRSAD